MFKTIKSFFKKGVPLFYFFFKKYSVCELNKWHTKVSNYSKLSFLLKYEVFEQLLQIDIQAVKKKRNFVVQL